MQIQDTIIETPVSGRAVFYRHPSLSRQKEIYQEVIELSKRYGGISKIISHWKFDKEKGLKGSNLRCLVLASEFLRDKERIPNVEEALALDKEGFLTNQYLVDYGVVYFSQQDPNKQIAEYLGKQLRRLKTPVILHPSDLQLSDNGETFKLRKSPNFLISGKKARDIIGSMSYKKDSGVCWLCRGGCGWVAGWGDLFFSDEDCRVVDFVRGEATTQKLRTELADSIDGTFLSQEIELTERYEEERKKIIKEKRKEQDTLSKVLRRKA